MTSGSPPDPNKNKLGTLRYAEYLRLRCFDFLIGSEKKTILHHRKEMKLHGFKLVVFFTFHCGELFMRLAKCGQKCPRKCRRKHATFLLVCFETNIAFTSSLAHLANVAQSMKLENDRRQLHEASEFQTFRHHENIIVRKKYC